MNFLRKHWYDLGGVLALVVSGYLLLEHPYLSSYQVLMWLSLISLFFHQLEEYRIVGTFPGMVNSILAGNDNERMDRYPLNANTALYVNVVVGWISYFLAAILAEKAIWLGLATMIVSLGNVIAHTTLFNIKGKTLYNAGLATCWLLFVPCIYFFIKIVTGEQLIKTTDVLAGVLLGMLLNYVGILKAIDWMKDKNTPYSFEQRNLLVEHRKNDNR
jgi:hypothetical protein